MLKAADVAKVLISMFQLDEDGISNLKLQKLLYYTQGFSYQRLNRPLFNDDFEAWAYGPVIREVYNTYKCCGQNPILSDDGDSISVDEQELELLLDVSREYGKYTGTTLSNMTHMAGGLWRKTYEKDKNNIISKELIKEEFQNHTPQLKKNEALYRLSDEDFVGYRDDDGFMVLPKEWDDEVQEV